ncbi:hypothetical protein C2L80_08635 [Rubneribacter badeniensis]|uniref:EpsG family protein n=1 Tax=Rubneribacter badeniensis TaxID=2070688 RepID=A0A2K2U423_9ACTN|nr:EpsG family protein [Rubneribacter badeniensis]PNV65067.1 hypothetical protein C2L80_08635 [Rubneribacter badeniensis]
MMGFLLTAASIAAGLIKRNSKVVAFIVLVVMWILMGCNTYNDDYDGSEFVFENYSVQIAGAGQTFGYQLLIAAAHTIGLSYLQFRMILSIIGLLCVFAFINRYTGYVAFVLVMYIICPFFYDIVQFRFFLASSIAIFGLIFLIEKRRFGTLLFVVFACVGISIHTACALYLLFLTTALDERKCMVLNLAIAFAFLFGVYSGLLAPLASYFVDASKFEVYFEASARFGYLQYWAVFALIMLLFWSISSRRKKKERKAILGPAFASEEGCCDRRTQFVEFSMKARFLLVPYLALLPLSVQNFYRLIRSMLPMVYLFFTIVLFERPAESRGMNAKLEKAMFVLWVGANALIVQAGVWDLVIVTELTENLFW